MKQRRLQWLLAALVVLAILRWLVPPRSEAPAPAGVSEAVTRPAPAASAPPTALVSAALKMRDAGDDVGAEPAGNAFAVRMPPPPPAPPAPPPSTRVAVKNVVTPPEPLPVAVAPAPPPPPFQVIGTWNDGTGPAVFVSSPTGALIARPGVVLMGEYSVTALTPQLLSLRHVAAKRDLQLPVPRAPGS